MGRRRGRLRRGGMEDGWMVYRKGGERVRRVKAECELLCKGAMGEAKYRAREGYISRALAMP